MGLSRIHPPGLAGCDGGDDCGSDCPYRQLAEARPDHRANFARLIGSYVPPAPCLHLGAPTGELAPCPTCPADLAGGRDVPLLACAIHGATTGKRGAPGHRSCHGCADQATARPRQITRIAGLPDPAFNPSLIRDGGRLLMAYRTALCGSRIHIATLDEDLAVVADTGPLALDHPRSTGGREDPRFFYWCGRLHLAFSGVEVDGAGRTIVHVLCARLTPDLAVERVWQPVYAERLPWEKNWGPFEWRGELLFVYRPAPLHQVLHQCGERVYPFAETTWSAPWAGGELRGGAAPVRVGDEFWSFFHGFAEHPAGNRYTLGLYTFGAQPPFAPRRITPHPILEDTTAAADRPRGENPAVYPCGAVRDGDRWLVSYGLHNSYCELAEFDHGDLEKGMVRV